MVGVEERQNFAEWLLKQWNTDNEKKRLFGTHVHECIARALNDGSVGDCNDEQCLACVQTAVQYHNQLVNRNYVLIGVECTIGCDSLGLVGTPDAVYYNEKVMFFIF